jgi:5-methylcytosine-specific restriction endonuclease McrA
MTYTKEEKAAYQKKYNTHYRSNKKYKIGKTAYDVKRLSERKIILVNLLGGKCVCCGVTEWWNLNFDHIIPVSTTKQKRLPAATYYKKLINGTLSLENLQILCSGCNGSKGNRKRCNLDHRL